MPLPTVPYDPLDVPDGVAESSEQPVSEVFARMVEHFIAEVQKPTDIPTAPRDG